MEIPVHFNTCVSADDILAAGADVAILTVGSDHFIPNIPGHDHAKSVICYDVLMHKAELGENVVVVGGGLTGAELAYDLASYEKNVTLVEGLDDILSSGPKVPNSVDMMLRELLGVEYVIYAGIKPNPAIANVDAGVVVAKENNVDFVIALGGGSVMDAGKAISFMVKQNEDYWTLVEQPELSVYDWLPVITIATDAGTGSEADPYFVVTNEELNIKRGFPIAKALGSFPVIAVVDPELMKSVPADFTAYQGFDAMFHSIEGYISNKANLMSDMYTLACVEAVYHNLETAVKDPDNIPAREKVAFGNNLSSIVMYVGSTTSHHSLEHALSAYHFTLPHGAGLLMICRAYFTHLIKNHACDERFVKLAQIMGKPDATDPMDFIAQMEKLMIACGVDNVKMSDYGITPDEFPKFVKNAKETMYGLFVADRISLSDEDCVGAAQFL